MLALCCVGLYLSRALASLGRGMHGRPVSCQVLPEHEDCSTAGCQSLAVLSVQVLRLWRWCCAEQAGQRLQRVPPVAQAEQSPAAAQQAAVSPGAALLASVDAG